MRLSVKLIATAALAVFLMPAIRLCAEEGANPSTGVSDGTAANSSMASVADPGRSLPMPIATVAAAMPYSRGRNSYTPRVEWFMGYSYLRAVPTLAAANRLDWLNGGSTSIAFNLTRYLGLVGDFGGFNETRLLLTTGNPPRAAAPYQAVDDGTVFTFLAGPRFSFRSHERFTPFVQALFGDVRASQELLCPSCTPSLPTENAFALTAGGGLDIKASHHFAIRAIQAEYMMTRFENFAAGKTAGQNDMRLSSGLVFRFGGNPAPQLPELAPLSYSCSVNPSSVYAGDAVTVSGTALNMDPAKTAAYSWSVDSGVVSGASSTETIDTTNFAAGAYTLKGHVSEGGKPGENADCSASYVVKAFEPPTVSCSANPSSVLSGDSSAITAIGVSPENRPLTYSYSSTSGSVSGAGSTATLATAGAALGPVAVTCSVADDKGGNASAVTSVTIAAPAAAPSPSVSELCSIQFERDTRRPSRVDNEAKACLDQVALSLQRSSDAKLAIIGNASSAEKARSKLASERAINAKAYLVNEKGIDSSRITVYTGLQDGKVVSSVLIPAGATFDTTGNTPVQ
jgi:outer membrane protein OmpA-like peptidoglycan-associated protein